LKVLIDGTTTRAGNNTSYWKTDLLNSGLFKEARGYLVFSGKYPRFVHEIKNFNPDPFLNDEDWEIIRGNPLVATSPFKDSLQEIFENISNEQFEESRFTERDLSAPLIEVISEQQNLIIPEIDILSNDERYANSSRRIRNSIWSYRIKTQYKYFCATPKCDVVGSIFVEAAHIKPDNVSDEDIPHRSHLLNGLCLCKHCHSAFDHGFFTLSDDFRIIISSRFETIRNQNIKTVIMSSKDFQIKDRIDRRYPLVEFIQYHRIKKFIN
jgi:putative restriction endonuclease